MYVNKLFPTFVEVTINMHRYILILSLFFMVAATATATKTDTPTQEGIEVWTEANTLFIRNGEPNSAIVIYSVVGTKVKEIELKSSASEIPLNLAKGYYIVKIGEVARKIAVK